MADDVDFVDPFKVDQQIAPVAATPDARAAVPQPSGVDFKDPFDMGGESGGDKPLSRLGHVAATVTDIPSKIGAAFSEGAGKVQRGLNPFSAEYGREQDAYLQEMRDAPFYDIRPTLKSLGRTGSGVMGAVEAIFSPLTGTGRSVIGHAYEAVRPGVTDENRKKLEAAGIHLPTGDEVADLMMAAVAPGRGKLPVPAGPPALRKPSGPLDVMLSEGQETGDLAKIQAEQRSYSGQNGPAAQNRAVEFFEQQQPQQVAAAKESVGRDLAPQSQQWLSADEAAQGLSDWLGQQHQQRTTGLDQVGQVLDLERDRLRQGLAPTGTVLAETPADAANIVSGAIGRAEEAAKAATTEAYGRFEALPGQFNPATFNRVAAELRDVLARPEDPTQLTRINPQTTPQAHAALDDLQDILGGLAQRRDELGRVLPRTPVTPALVENARKRLNTFLTGAVNAARSTNNWSDVSAMEKVIDAFDDMVIAKLRTTFSGGSAGDVMRELEGARQLHREHRQTYFSRGRGDTVGPQIQKILGQHEGQAATPEQVSSALYGNNGVAIGRRLIDIFGRNSPEIGAVRQGLFSHIMEAPPGVTEWTRAKIADRIEQFTQGKGRSLTETYLTRPEIEALRDHGRALRAHHDVVTAPRDSVDRLIAQIAGADGSPASIKFVTDKLFGGVLRGAKDAPEIVRRIYGRDPASPQAGWFRQGLLRHAIEDGLTEKEYGPQRIADNLTKLVNSEGGRIAYSPDQRALIRELADLHRKLVIPQRGANWSGTAAAERPILDKILSVAVAGVTGMITHFVLPFPTMGLGEAGAGIIAAKLTPDLVARRATKQMIKQLPLMAEEAAKYRRALAAYNANPNPATVKNLTVFATNLSRSMLALESGLQHLPRIAPPLATGPAGAEQRRDEGNVPGPVEQRPNGGDVEQRGHARGYAGGGSPSGDDGTDLDEEQPSAAGSPLSTQAVDEPLEAQSAAESAAAQVRHKYPNVSRPAPPLLTTVPEHLGADLYKTGKKLATAVPSFLEAKNRELNPQEGDVISDTDVTPENIWAGATAEAAGAIFPGYRGKFLAPFMKEAAETAGREAAPRVARLAANAADRETATGAARNEAGRELTDTGFYSHGAEAARALTQQTGTPDQMRAVLERQGVRKEEFDNANWDLVFGAKTKVSKDEIATLFRDATVPVQEVWHSGAHTEDPFDSARRWVEDHTSHHVDSRAYDRAVEQKAAEFEKQNKGSLGYGPEEWQDINTPGGTNHRELLITTPVTESPKVAALRDELEELVAQPASVKTYKGEDRTTAYDRLAKEFFDAGGTQTRPTGFKSKHWDEPNVLAHVRMQDQIIDGKKTLLVDELQSDWHQAGRKKGYKQPVTPEDTSGWRVEVSQDNTFTGQRAGTVFDADGKVRGHFSGSRATDDELKNRFSERRAQEANEGKIPDAPFKTSWPDLAMKRVLKHAADNGYDQVAWTSGATQAARYDLSKHVNKIDYNPESGKLWGYDHNGAVAIDTRVPKDKLAEHVGKDAAEKLLATPEDKGWHSLKGTDLKVDAPGMTGFYDKILPAKVNALVKKHGTKVEQAELPVQRKIDGVSGEMVMNDMGIEPSEQSQYWRNLSQRGRDRMIEEYREKKGAVTKESIHVVPITPSLRDELSGGVRMFANKADEGTAARNETIHGLRDDLHGRTEPAIGGEHGSEGRQAPAAAEEAATARGPGGTGSVEEAQAAATRAAGAARPLEGLPTKPLTINAPGGDILYVPGPIERIHQIAEDYMRDSGLRYQPITSYREVNVGRAKRIADEYAKMPHAPNDPAVKASYDAMIEETVAQLKALQKSGLNIEFIKPGMKDPYEASPRLAQMDVRDNNHLWVFPTDAGFGTDAASAEALKNNPLLRKTGITIDGRELMANDAFRIVHDFFGHLKDGVGFRAGGEENAWRSHSRMYSKLARPAMTSETRGQNSWLNYGPHGDKNRTAKSADTVYADQKTGIMPNWTHTDGVQDYYVAPAMRDVRGHESVNAGVEAPPNKRVQTVADPHRMMFPHIYENPRRIASEAAERIAPEDLAMKKMWGVSRGDLSEMAKSRIGNEEPIFQRGKGTPRGSLSAQNIQTPQNTQRLIDILHESGKYPGLRHADAWYIMDPVYHRLEQMFGPEEAVTRYKHFNTMMAMASPGSEVMTEIQRGTAAHHMALEGRFADFLRHAGTPREWRKGPKDLAHVEAHPYHRTAQAEPMEKYLEHGSIQSENVKVPLYAHASGVPQTGFQTTAPVPDAHFSRGVGLSDTRKGPTDVAGSGSRSELQTLQPWWRDEVAGELGLESVPAQARLWTALAPRTGVTSSVGAGKLELLTRQIERAARRMGVTPERARDLILSGKASAGALAAFALGMHGMDTDEAPKRAAGGRVVASNIERDPTEAQKKAGNYAKDHVSVHGLDITVENAKDSVRTGTGADGVSWRATLHAHYGYVKRTEGADGDHVDVYLGPHMKSPRVYVIDQVDPHTGKFDEHKVMLGFGSEAQARTCYARCFSDGKGSARIGRIHEMAIERFKAWLRDGDTTKPFAHTIPQSEKREHASVGYVEESKRSGEQCSGCMHYIPGAPPGCEGVKSPIAPIAWCRRYHRAK